MPAKKRQQPKVIVRLARLGPRGEGGVARYYYRPTGKMYTRDRIYKLEKNLANELLATGKFERIHPDDLERAIKEAKAPRGMSLNDRQRAKRREAMLKKRRQSVLVDGDGALDDDSVVEGDDDLLDTGAAEAEGDGEQALTV